MYELHFFFFTCLLAWETQEANAKPRITNRFLNACNSINVLSIVIGTYLGGGGGRVWGWGGIMGGGGRDVKWQFYVPIYLGSISRSQLSAYLD